MLQPSPAGGVVVRAPASYGVVTFGCRVNAADTQALETTLMARGVVRAEAEQAELVIVNTCSVTATADQGARQAIRRLHRLNPGARIVVTGCYASRRPDEVTSLPGVLAVVSNTDKDDLLEAVGDALGLTSAERYAGGPGPCGAMTPGHGGRTVWTLRVQTGCEQSCSYCIIPTTRGAARSLPVAHVLRTVDAIVERGYREVVVTGVHLGSYGRDLAPASSLASLLRALDAHGAPVRYRLSSLEPMDCSDAVVEVIAGSPRFAPHLHLPLQHASDRVLAAMRRPYTLADYVRAVGRVRDLVPDAAIGSDLIVGFPGETDADADMLCDYLSGAPLTHLHVFPYSDRPGTLAASLPARVHGSIVRERLARLRPIARRLLDAFHAAQVGRVLDAITLDDGTVALTGNYCKVRIGAGRQRNERVSVRITNCHPTVAGDVVA